jgi:hypothetical protein
MWSSIVSIHAALGAPSELVYDSIMLTSMVMIMGTLELFGTVCITGDEFTTAEHDNENLRLLSDWMTPAEAMQWIRQRKERLKRKLAADFTLRSDPEFRLDWEIAIGLERCTLWHCYGERS